MSVVTWGQELAEVYDKTNAAGFEPSVLDPMVGALAELAGAGPVLELAIGTGRVALPLSARGLRVRGSSFPSRWRPGSARRLGPTLCP